MLQKGKGNWACKCKFQISLKCNVDDKIMYFYTTDYRDEMLIAYYSMHDFPVAFIKSHREILSSYQTFCDDSTTAYIQYTHSSRSSSWDI